MNLESTTYYHFCSEHEQDLITFFSILSLNNTTDSLAARVFENISELNILKGRYQILKQSAGNSVFKRNEKLFQLDVVVTTAKYAQPNLFLKIIEQFSLPIRVYFETEYIENNFLAKDPLYIQYVGVCDPEHIEYADYAWFLWKVKDNSEPSKNPLLQKIVPYLGFNNTDKEKIILDLFKITTMNDLRNFDIHVTKVYNRSFSSDMSEENEEYI